MPQPAFTLTFLGTGTSIGVPVIGCGCPVCTSGDPVNERLRCSLHVTAPDERSWIVDTGPDLRTQCLREGIVTLDAVLYTHEHTDHIMGFDDLRRFTVPADAELPIYANAGCLARIETSFHYAFNGENRYVGYLKPRPHIVTGPFSIGGTTVTPLAVEHGKVSTLGYRFDHPEAGGFAYLPDVKAIPDATRDQMRGLDVLILDALQEQPHPTHLSIDEALEVAADLAARETWLTHFSCRMDYRRVAPRLPTGVGLARDRQRIRIGG